MARPGSFPVAITGILLVLAGTGACLALAGGGHGGAPPLARDMIAGSTPSWPNQVTGVVATGGNQNVTLSWTEPNDNGNSITGYNVYRSTTADGTYTEVVHLWSSLSWVDTAVSNAATYFYKVAAVNSQG